MSHGEQIRLCLEGSEKTVSFSHEQIDDSKSADQIAWQLHQLIEEEEPLAEDPDSHRRLNLDFHDIDWLSTAALNHLIGINNKARSYGIRLVLTNVNDSVREVFVMTRLERMFEMVTSDEMPMVDRGDR